MDVFEKIDHLLYRKGVSRRKMCQYLGLSASSLNGSFVRKTRIPISNLNKIAEFLGVTAEFLLEDSPEFRTLTDSNVSKIYEALFKALGFKNIAVADITYKDSKINPLFDFETVLYVSRDNSDKAYLIDGGRIEALNAAIIAEIEKSYFRQINPQK